MKIKIFAFLAMVGLVSINGVNALDDISSVVDAAIAFKELKKSQKNEWFNFAKKEEASKMDLIQKHFNEWKDAEISVLKSWKGTMQTTPEQQLSTKKDILVKAVDLYEKQRDEWRSMCMENGNTAKDLDAKHTEALNAFKSKYLNIEASNTDDAGEELEIIEIDVPEESA